ncbi:MAG: DUF1799 domain-containing protein [Burkholderiaceae bacterium]|nr:DUF1799 domain-containing protein [Burkholderiaceae bacterium]
MSDELAEDMAFFGASDEIADAPTEQDLTVERYEIWPENLTTLTVFIDLSTQWDRVAEADGVMTRTRLIWESFEVLMRHSTGIPRRDHAKIFTDIRRMEKVALAAMGEEVSKQREERRREAEQK